jgi:integrase
LDESNRCVRLTTHKTFKKTGRPLIIPLTTPALELLRHLAARHPSGPLFRTARGRPMSAHFISVGFTKLKERCNLSGNVIPYGFRHTVATELLTKDVAPQKVAYWLGHKDLRMVFEHYGHLDKSTREIALEIDRVLNGDDAGKPSA